VSPRARYRCFTSRQGSRNHGETSRSLEMPRTGILSNRPSMRRPAGVKVSSFLFRGTRFYPAEPAPRAGKNVHRIAIRCTRNPALNYSAVIVPERSSRVCRTGTSTRFPPAL